MRSVTSRTAVLCLGFFACLSFSGTLNGQCFIGEDRVDPSDLTLGQRFGTSVDIHGGWLVVGAPQGDGVQTESGVVYLYQSVGGGWVEAQVLQASDSQTGDAFGHRVAIFGGQIVVGAPFADGSQPLSGAAYVFEFQQSQWVQSAKLVASDGATDDRFGWAVSVREGTIALGAPFDDDLGVESGSAYVFRENSGSYVEEAKIVESTLVSGDQFGFAVALQHNVLACGAPRRDVNGYVDAGMLYTFNRVANVWTFDSALNAVAAESVTALYGSNVAFSKGSSISLIAGIPNPSDYGKALVWDRPSGSVWNIERLIVSAHQGNAFGFSAGISDTVVAIGVPVGRLPLIGAPGYIQVYCRGSCGWQSERKAFVSDGSDGDFLGYACVVDGERIAVGTPFVDGTGSAYVLSELDPNSLQYGVPTPGSNGYVPTIGTVGCPILGQDFRLVAGDSLGGGLGALLIGLAPVMDNSRGWVQWVDVTGPPPGAIIPIVYRGSGAGNGTFEFDLGLPNSPLLNGIRLYFQFTVIDPNSTYGVAATRGLLVQLRS